MFHPDLKQISSSKRSKFFVKYQQKAGVPDGALRSKIAKKTMNKLLTKNKMWHSLSPLRNIPGKTSGTEKKIVIAVQENSS